MSPLDDHAPTRKVAHHARSWGAELLASVVALTVLAVFVVAFFLPAVGGGPASPRAQCSNNLKQLGLAMQIYRDEFGTYPPAYVADEHGRPQHSWRVLLLPYLGERKLYDEYDFREAWDGPHNRKLLAKMPDLYKCPGDKSNHKFTTNYVAVLGDRTAWPINRRRESNEISDGMSNTILLVEAVNAGIPWMAPRDLDFELLDFKVSSTTGYGPSSAHSTDGANVLLYDGHTMFLRSATKPDTLRALLTVDGGEEPGRIPK